MGLYSNLNDVQTESIPLFLVILAANCINYLRDLLLGLIHSMGFSRFESIDGPAGDRLFGSVGSGLAGLIVISEQSALNRVFSYKNENLGSGSESESDKSDKCVVCLCRLRDGAQVRKLACRHVFHKACLDSWLIGHSKLTCPLCRTPLACEERCDALERRVGSDVVTWFSMRW